MCKRWNIYIVCERWKYVPNVREIKKFYQVGKRWKYLPSVREIKISTKCARNENIYQVCKRGKYLPSVREMKISTQCARDKNIYPMSGSEPGNYVQLKLLCGVPQGTVLTLLPFLIMANDLSKNYQHSSVSYLVDTRLLGDRKSWNIFKRIERKLSSGLVKITKIWHKYRLNSLVLILIKQ